jgi:NDP-sugar pyrophosphorylase family protein
MKAVILAGGFGTRLSEETVFCPKPMVEIGGKPILWHIMNIYAAPFLTQFWLFATPNPSCYLLEIHELLRFNEGEMQKSPDEEEAHGRDHYSDVLPV